MSSGLQSYTRSKVMPKKEKRFENVAVELYAKRVGDDQKKGIAGVYSTNPDARVLYFKGVHDALVCTRVWLREADQDTLAELLAALERQTRDQPSH